MGDYPDPDEEYELMYGDDLELLKEHEDNIEPNIIKKKPLPAKRSLDFSSPVAKKPTNKTVNEDIVTITNSQLSLTPDLQPMEETPPLNASNKRTADDLFGDINDIDFDTIELPSKRQKTEEETDFELINKIVEARKLKQLLLEPSHAQRKVQPVFDVKENLSLDIPRWPFMPVTNSEGDRVYVKIESEDAWDESLDTTTDHRSLHSLYTKTWEEARQMLEKKQQEEIARQSQEALPEVIVDINSNNLWVEKYKPKCYLDLLSEEPVNRALLHWLHLWDKVVFKKEVKTSEPQQRTSFSKRTGQFQLNNTWKGKRELEPELDEDGRPHHKVALLCGPPGVGKTTLAHLLARVAGYRPVELNASDERSTEAFRNALQSATLMRSVLDAEKRPNCLILDEIDGAPLPTVELLVKWCTATAPDGKKKAKSQPLKRPVIAICNDLYATSLRPLRPVSLVIHVHGVSLPRLSSRLGAVAAVEGVCCAPHVLSAPVSLVIHVHGVSLPRLSSRLGAVAAAEGVCCAPHVLSALAARAHGDVRTALQALNFTAARGDSQLKMEDVEKLTVGNKDCSKSLMQALIAVFTASGGDVAKTIHAAGEYERIVDGIFENYLSGKVDSRLHIACETLSWLRLYDEVYSWTLRGQNYSLYGLLPMCIVRCHSLLASKTPPKLRFPMQAQEVNKRKNEIDSIVTSVWRGSSPAVLLPRNPLRLDLLPLLPYLLSPTLRSANVQLCSESERKALKSCAGAMCDYGLQYVQQRTNEGLYAFQLEPDAYKAAFIGNEDKIRPPPPVRQAIAREQQLEVIRRNEEMASRVNQNRPPSENKPVARAPTPAPTKEARLPNHLQRLEPKAVTKVAPQVHKDFFGRIVPLSQIQRSDAVPDVISSSSVFYQYREGFNNAVRRNVRMRDLI